MRTTINLTFTFCLLLTACSGPPVEYAVDDVAAKTQKICINGPGYPSCYGSCGHIDCGSSYPSLCCACDTGCELRGDCCCDFEEFCPAVPTCEGHCGGESPGGCFCDTECTGFGDCCGDFETTCDGPIQVDMFGRHGCARTETGRVRCWGANTVGQLGQGHVQTIGDNEAPLTEGDIDLGVLATDLNTGGDFECVLVAHTGQVRCWGGNQYGQLGVGNTVAIGDNELPSAGGPVQLGGVAKQVAAGTSSACAVLTTGAVRCWGANNYGQLGYGHTNNIGDNETPASAGNVNVGGTVASIDSSGSHTCAVLTTGAVRCWGANNYGQLGYGHTNNIGDNETPASAGSVVVGAAVKQVATGVRHTCALTTTGTVRCWGMSGGWGSLGYGNDHDIGDDETPASAGNVNVGGTVTKIVAGWDHTCALLSTGTVRCWGRNDRGQLGYGHMNNIGDNETPASVPPVPVGGTVIDIAADYFSTCAVLSTGAIRCWGYNDWGQLGLGNAPTIVGDNEPITSVPPPSIF